MDHARPWLRYVEAGDLGDSALDCDGLNVENPSGDKLGDVNGFVLDADSGRPQADDKSPHLGGRAQAGDVIGVETGGERTYLGDTSEDENERRRDAETAARKLNEK